MEYNFEGIGEDTFDEDNEICVNDEEAQNLENQEIIEFFLNDETYLDDLADWEVDFLTSLLGKTNLTEKQQIMLDKIWFEIMQEEGRN